MQRANSNSSNTASNNQNYEVSIFVGSIGVVQLSGVYKQKDTVQKILNGWRTHGIRANITRNTAGNAKGYQLRIEADHPLVGFLNLFEGNTRDVDAIETQVRAVREFTIGASVVTDKVADLI